MRGISAGSTRMVMKRNLHLRSQKGRALVDRIKNSQTGMKIEQIRIEIEEIKTEIGLNGHQNEANWFNEKKPNWT